MPHRKKNEFQKMDLGELISSADTDKLIEEWRKAHPDSDGQAFASHCRSRKGVEHKQPDRAISARDKGMPLP